jgi:hypothetical protein
VKPKLGGKIEREIRKKKKKRYYSERKRSTDVDECNDTSEKR